MGDEDSPSSPRAQGTTPSPRRSPLRAVTAAMHAEAAAGSKTTIDAIQLQVDDHLQELVVHLQELVAYYHHNVVLIDAWHMFGGVRPILSDEILHVSRCFLCIDTFIFRQI
ncbi:hypothetical protein BRADI_3g44481v3 [Brachypodium distachyon]|uniref:Uncharacterized protein n=1 Tax=Brachypodium distachyon TaxID=15368 RepID=A0A2K2D379_BRADI|nr:hypothetical protein BRADI_3g44481v3 [Brachypodium distachyon]